MIWDHNASTGMDLSSVGPAKRIRRQRFNDGSFLYSAEYWGDYSLAFPVRGNWRGTLAGAMKDFERLAP